MSRGDVFPARRSWLLLGVGLLFLLAFQLGARGLNEPDEGRYANIARAMVLSGDWWEPRMSGLGHYDKPPLIYWATAACFRVFGLNEWAARIPSLCGALSALAGLGWAAWRLYGARTAWYAALICGTTLQFWALGRVLSPDMLLTGWCALAVGAWAECRHRGGAWSIWLLSLAFWSLAWWTKATPTLIPLAGLAIGVYFTGDSTGSKSLRPWLLLPGILLLGSPWYLSMLHQYPELRGFFFGRELAGRVTGHVDGRRGSLFYYLFVSIIGWLPWWPLAGWHVWRSWPALPANDATRRSWRAWLGIEGWIILTGLVIFSLVSSKLPTYTLILAPWAALSMARIISRAQATSDEENKCQPRSVTALAGGFALIAMTSAIWMPRYDTSWGVNSSLREICAFLQTHSANQVAADRYWPGMEFYLGDEKMRYIIRNSRQQERTTDLGLPPDRFMDPKDWLRQFQDQPKTTREDCWLVRFRKQEFSPFKHLLIDGVEPKWIRMGHFDLLHLTETHDRITLPAPHVGKKSRGRTPDI